MQAGRTRMVIDTEEEESYDPKVYEDGYDPEEDNPNVLL